MAKGSGFGKMDVGLVNQVNKVNKNYNTEIAAAGINSFMGATKPLVEKSAKAQGAFDKIMTNIVDASQVPTANAEQQVAMQPVVDAYGAEAQKYGKILASDPTNLAAQAGYNKALSKLNNVSAGQTELFKNTSEAKVVFDNNDYSPGQTQLSKDHAMSYIGGSGFTESYGDLGYKTIKMEDGTIYDNDPNTEFPSIPGVEGSFKEGQTTMLKSWNTNVGNIKDSAVDVQLRDFNSEAQSNTLYSQIMASGIKADGKPGAAPTYGQQMDLLFSDISGDDQSVTYASMWINGGLDKSFYVDANGQEITNTQGEKFSELPLDERENMLRDKTRGPNNMKNLARFYANTMKTGLEDKQISNADNNGTLIMNLDPEDTAKPFIAKNVAEAKAKKKNMYVNMTLDREIDDFMGLKIVDGKMETSQLINMFKNEQNMEIKPVPNSEGTGLAGVALYTKLDKDGDGSGKKLALNFNNAADVKEFKRIMEENANVYQNLDYSSNGLGSNPREWKTLNGEDLYTPVGNYEPNYKFYNEKMMNEEPNRSVDGKGNYTAQTGPNKYKGEKKEIPNNLNSNYYNNYTEDRPDIDEIMSQNDSSNPYSLNYEK